MRTQIMGFYRTLHHLILTATLAMFFPGGLLAAPLQNINADEFLRQVRAGAIQGDVEVYHIQGRAMPAALEEAIIILKQNGFEVSGNLITPSQFNDALDRMAALGRAGHDPSRTSYAIPHLPGTRDFPASSVNDFKNRIFGTPQGVTFFRYFKRLFRPTSEQVGATIEALVIANPILYFALSHMQQGENSHVRMAAPLFVLSGWIAAYILNIDQIAGFKGQGGSMELNPQAPQNRQVQIKSNQAWVFATSFAQEVILNSLLIASMFPIQDITGGMFLNAMVNAPLATFAKTPFESHISNLINESEDAQRRGQSAQAQALKRRAIIVERVSSNYLFPALKLLHLVAPALISHSHSAMQTLVANASWIGLMATGLGGMAIKAYQARDRIAALFRKAPPALPCETALVIFPRLAATEAR